MFGTYNIGTSEKRFKELDRHEQYGIMRHKRMEEEKYNLQHSLNECSTSEVGLIIMERLLGIETNMEVIKLLKSNPKDFGIYYNLLRERCAKQMVDNSFSIG